MSKNSFSDIVQGWRELLAGLDLNAAEFPQFEAARAELRTLLDETVEANDRQGVSSSIYHQDTRDLEERLDRGGELATRLRNAVRAEYGNKGERLRQFGLNPLRRRRNPLTPTEAAARAAERAEAAIRAAKRAAARAALATEDPAAAPSAILVPPKS